MQKQHIYKLSELVKKQTSKILADTPTVELVRLDFLQALVLAVAAAVCEAVIEAWKERLLSIAEQLARPCAKCGMPRKWRWRSGKQMSVSLLGFSFELPNPYVECGHCDTPGLSVIKLLTDLHSGDSSTELELMAARCAALDSYGVAARELEAHHGVARERTKLRRMALKIEAHAMCFAQKARHEALERKVSEPGPKPAPPWLTIEADGGKVRTGRLQPCEKGDPGYRKRTAKRGVKRRKRPAEWRELITIDVRAPGEVEPRALDLLMPNGAPKGERSRRMRASALRSGLGKETKVQGLGDMGSKLASSLKAAFPGRKRFWLADWNHTHDYVKNAGKVLTGIDPAAWCKEMNEAIWKRDWGQRDRLLNTAYRCRLPKLPPGFEKCPVRALQTYLKNNWENMQHRFAKANKLPIVSARAECQVRERTKRRFSVPGAWLPENIEPKATLRAIIDADEWMDFREYLLNLRHNGFTSALVDRLEAAVASGRIHPDVLKMLTDESTLVSTGKMEEKEHDQTKQKGDTAA